MNELALFAGAGGGILGGQLLGWETVCAVEVNDFCARRLMQRQNEGHLPCFPIWDDVCTFDGRPWRGIVDVVSGGFPCQDISVAGKGAGIDGERSGLWGEMARIIDEVRPRFVFVENSPALTLRGLGRVLGDLAEMGYDAEWGVLGASDVGSRHKRERIWIVGHTERQHAGGDNSRESSGTRMGVEGNCLVYEGRCEKEQQLDASSKDMADTEGLHDRGCDTGKGKRQVQQLGICSCKGNVSDTDKQHDDCGRHGAGKICRDGQTPSGLCHGEQEICDTTSEGFSKRTEEPMGKSKQIAKLERPDWWATEPDVGRVANGVAFRVDRLRAIGNGQVPQCAAEAWRRLLARNN